MGIVAVENGVETPALQTLRAIPQLIDKYLFLRDLQQNDSEEFFQLLTRNTKEILPYVYTPTVGTACQRYHELPLITRGLYITLHDKGRILEKLQAWPVQDIKVIVVTDGERILGLGDLGTGGMGISEGKILLYTVAAGVDPSKCLPICLDVGTNNEALLQDKKYKGLRQKRLSGKEYDAFVDEFMQALKYWKRHVLLQFEDFGNTNAFRLLDRYCSTHCCFNDDIQGTACITLAGILSALRATGASLADQRFLFLGAGEAGTGIGELIALALQRRFGMTREEGRKHCYFMDSKGLVCASRNDLQHHKQPFAHDVAPQRTLLDAIAALRPTVLIGVSTIAGAFNRDVFDALLSYLDRPIVFPLSNPTSKSECTFAQAFEWSNGKVLFASGSPFDAIEKAGKLHTPAQANNAYIFPAIGHAALLCDCKNITDDVFLVAAEALAAMTPVESLEQGSLFPSFDDILDVSVQLMARVAAYMEQSGLGTRPADCSDWTSYCRVKQWRV